MDRKKIIVGLLLLGAAVGSSALSLGRLQGAAWVGQALDVRVAVQLDEQEGANSLCPDVDVYHGDMQQPSGRVRVTVEPSTQPLTAQLRIQSATPVDEPVVTVYLKAGCQAKSSRRYVLLAELPVDNQPTALATQVSRATVAPVRTLPVVNSAGQSDSATVDRPKTAPRAQPVASTKTTKTKTSTQQRADAPANAPRVAASPKGSAITTVSKSPVAQSRLSLDLLAPLELRFDPVHRAAPAKSALAPGESAPSLLPLEAALENPLLKKLEGEVKVLRAQAVKNQNGLTEMDQRLRQAQTERYDNPLVYGLAALLLAALALLAYLWYRQSKANTHAENSWQDSVQAVNAMAASMYESGRLSSRQTGAQAVTSQLVEPGRVDVNLEDIIAHLDRPDTMPPMAVGGLEPKPSATVKFLKKRASDFSHSVANLMRAMPAKEMSDSRDQAGFFVSLGQTDEAINILKSIINTEGATSPWVYLDLLKIFHDMGMKEDYLHLCEKFRQSFKGRPPEFEWFKEEGRDLMAYPDVLAYICSLWPTTQVLKVLEANIFRAEGEGRDSDFDLNAFRELLLLHAVTLSKLESAANGGGEARAVDRRR